MQHCFLACDEADYITGVTLPVDGARAAPDGRVRRLLPRRRTRLSTSIAVRPSVAWNTPASRRRDGSSSAAAVIARVAKKRNRTLLCGRDRRPVATPPVIILIMTSCCMIRSRLVGFSSGSARRADIDPRSRSSWAVELRCGPRAREKKNATRMGPAEAVVAGVLRTGRVSVGGHGALADSAELDKAKALIAEHINAPKFIEPGQGL